MNSSHDYGSVIANYGAQGNDESVPHDEPKGKQMTRPEFEREIFGDTGPRTEIDYDYWRHQAARERRAAIASLPGRIRRMFGRVWAALSLLRHAASFSQPTRLPRAFPKPKVYLWENRIDGEAEIVRSQP
jgi:hypothetical protein